MKDIKHKTEQRARRRKRNRAKIFGTAERPRLSIFCSNQYASVQIIDDSAGRTLVAGSTKSMKSGSKSAQAKILGEVIAQKAAAAGVKKVVFNKGAYAYHGRVKAFAESARSKGLVF